MTSGWRGGLLGGGLAAAVVGGCVYLNTLYNAQRLYAEAEQARLEGLDSVARFRYDSVAAKAARSYLEDPGGDWADDALYLMGRAYLRQGDLPRATEAFERVRASSGDDGIRIGATLYLGAVAVLRGDRVRALALLNRALEGLEDGTLLAEGHLWRARANLAGGRIDAGWWDLDRAAEADPRLRVAADLERVKWGVVHGDTARARAGVRRLLRSAPSHLRVDTLMGLVDAAAVRWGPAGAAGLLAGAEESSWPPDERDRLLLLRADLGLREGDTLAARADARLVAAGFGDGATRARLLLADLVLARAQSVEGLGEVRPILLPAARSPAALEVLEAVRKVDLLHRRARRPGEEVALFAAAELARDDLGAVGLARELFVEYSDRAAPSPWAGKALLAALALTPPAEVDARRALERRITSMERNPYVRAVRTGWFPAAEFERLEADLREALRRVVTEVTAEAVQLDLQLRARGDTLF